MKTYRIATGREGFYQITAQVAEAVREAGLRDGACLVHCPHTTAAVTINENADPDVVHDLLLALNALYPDRPDFRHREGNSAAHLKSSVIGCGVLVPVEKGRLALGAWQGIYFCEFDGPRQRSFAVQILG